MVSSDTVTASGCATAHCASDLPTQRPSAWEPEENLWLEAPEASPALEVHNRTLYKIETNEKKTRSREQEGPTESHKHHRKDDPHYGRACEAWQTRRQQPAQQS